MKAILAIVAAVVMNFVALPARAADEARATTAEAEAMVKKAIAHYKKAGKAKAMEDFSKSPGPFVDRDLYVTVYTLDGIDLAHINPKMVGKNMMDLRDADGKYHIKERLEAARTQNAGWQDFKFFNPVSKQIEPKRMYWEKYDNLVFACGAYKPN